MTPPVFHLPAPALDEVGVGDVVALTGPEGRHAAGSLRMSAGEAVVVVDGSGCRVTGTVTRTEGRGTAFVEIASVERGPEPQPRITVVQALPKGERGELAVELLTEIGVDAIVPWAARHCVAQWKGERSERGHRRWTDAARAAAKQSRRARFPEVLPRHRTEDVVALARAADLALVLHETAEMPIGAFNLPRSGSVVLVVGPEGGLADDEVAALTAAGAHSVLLGPTVLRTSTAGIAAASALLARSPRWGAGASTPEVKG